MSPAGVAPDRIPISACIVAMNEEDRLGPCLDSLDWCDELLVVDSHSTDQTRQLAAARGARVIERDWPGHAAQKEFAVRAARHDWVFCIDADERVSPELRAAIEAERRGEFAGAAHAAWGRNAQTVPDSSSGVPRLDNSRPVGK